MKRQPLRTRAPSRLVARPTPNVAPLQDSLGYALRRAQLAAYKCYGEVFGSTGITPAQYSVLLVIELNPGLRQNQVSDALGIKRANFVGLIDTLEKRGLVVRHSTTTDGRAYALHLSEGGETYIRSLHALSAKLEQRLGAKLSKSQRKAMMSALNAIADAA
jgi:DNA-binding MarR family transcriptional regulator